MKLSEKYRAEIRKIVANNKNKTNRQIREEIRMQNAGIKSKIFSDRNYSTAEYMELYNKEDSIINEEIAKNEDEKIKEEEKLEKEKQRIREEKIKKQEEKELKKEALQQIKEEERRKQEKWIKIICYVAAIFYIMVIFYSLVGGK